MSETLKSTTILSDLWNCKSTILYGKYSNDMYAKDISKKISSVKHDKQRKGLCHECGRPLVVLNRKNAAGEDKLYFVCRTYQRFTKAGVYTSHTIKEETVTRAVVLSPEARALYEGMERDALLELEGDIIDAGSKEAVNGKLLQIAGGAVYSEDHVACELRTEKLDSLEDVLEEAVGEPVLVAYRYQHEPWPDSPGGLAERQRHHRRLEPRGDTPAFGVPRRSRAWAEPPGRGHIIVWYGPTYDLELDEQFNDRLYRQGQPFTTSIIYLVAGG